MQSKETCLSAQELTDYSAGWLTGNPLTRITEHLAGCPECRERLAALSGTEAPPTSDLPREDLLDTPTAMKGPGIGQVTAGEPITAAWRATPANQAVPEGRPVPEQLREYRLLAPLGEGGMGAVYRAVHTRLDKVVALKVLSAQRTNDPAAVARFQREMRAVGKLNHPHIVQATDAGEVEGVHFLVMEYVEGTDVAKLIRKHGPLPIGAACELARQAALGLEYAHTHGLVHRDVKPSNLLLSRDGQVKLLDLGLALLQEVQSVGEAQTTSGLVMGTLDYVAPEQIDDPHAVDGRADLYSLGCTLYHLLAGRPPFGGPDFRTLGQKLKAHALKPVPPIRSTRPEVPEALAAILERLLAKDPADRCASAAEVVALLAPFADSLALATLRSVPTTAQADNPLPTLSQPPSLEKPIPPAESRWRGWLVACVLLGLFGIVVAAGIIRIQTDRGILEIETVDNDVKVIVENGGDLVTVLDLKTQKEFKLRSGKYQLKLGEGASGLELDITEVTLERAGKAIARIRRRQVEPAVPAKARVVRPPVAEPGEVRRFEGHTAQVNCVAVTRDGKFAVSGGNDASVRIWDVATGKTVRLCRGVKEAVWALAVSPDGRYILGGGGGVFRDDRWLDGEDFALHLWELASGREVRRLTGHTRKVMSVAFSPDGKRAVSAGYDHMVRYWDVEKGVELHCLHGHSQGLDTVSISPDGRQAVSAGYDRTIRLWDLEKGKELRQFKGPGHTEVIRSVAFSPNGHRLLTGSLDRTLRLWDVATGDELRVFPRHPTGVMGVAFSPDGRLALSTSGSVLRTPNLSRPAGYDYTLRLWDVEGRELHQFEGHTNSLIATAFLPDGHHALTTSSDQTLRLWRLPEPMPVAPFPADEARTLQKRWAAVVRQLEAVPGPAGIILTLVPPGEFELAPGCRAQVTKPFYMGLHEVTVAQFRKFVEETGYRTEAETSGKGGTLLLDGKPVTRPEYTWRHPEVTRAEDRPVVLVSWNDAVRFCEWLSQKEQKVYRLPTVAEWHWAAEAGFTGTHPRRELDERVWHRGNAEDRAHSAGKKTVNAWGLHDTFGNVAEFCQDWRGDYPQGTVADPRGPEKGRLRTVSGGSYLSDPARLRQVEGVPPNAAFMHVGFRVVRELPEPETPSPRFATLVDGKVQAYRDWLKRIKTEGFRPVRVSAALIGGRVRFAAIALRDRRSLAWEANEGLDARAYQEAFNKYAGQGYRLLSVCAYPDGKEPRFASLWVRDGRPVGWRASHDVPGVEVQAHMTQQQAGNSRPDQVVGYPFRGATYFVSLFRPANGAAWILRWELTAEQLKAVVDAGRGPGYRPVSLSAYPSEGDIRFAVVMLRDNPALRWQMRQELSADAFQQENDHWTSRGYRPLLISGYERKGQARYLAVWVVDRYAEPPLPRTGKAVAELEPLDRAMDRFMRQRGIRAGALAVMKDGRLLLSRAYGYTDAANKVPVTPDTPFRLASVTKPITAAAIRKLVRAGKLKLDAKVYELLRPEPPAGEKLDPRWKDITIAHLLEHKGGWDRDKAFDPMFRPIEIAVALGKPGPASAGDVVRYMAGQPLQFAPGGKTSYSNFGYCLLGRVIEKVTGQSYLDYILKEVLEPAGAKGVFLGRSLPRDRDRREPVYDDPDMGRNVIEPGSKDWVPAPDGSFHLEAMDSHGGLVASAVDVARFLSVYRVSGELAEGKPRLGAAFGSLPGTFTMALQRADGVQIVTVFNRRKDPSGRDYFAIKGAMNQATDAVKRWPLAQK